MTPTIDSPIDSINNKLILINRESSWTNLSTQIFKWIATNFHGKILANGRNNLFIEPSKDKNSRLVGVKTFPC